MEKREKKKADRKERKREETEENEIIKEAEEWDRGGMCEG